MRRYRTPQTVPLTPAQQEFLQAFLTAHEKKDLEAEEKLVDWDDVTDYSRDFLRRGLQDNLGVKIASANIEDIPGFTPYFVVTHNIPPEKFFVVVYDDPRGTERFLRSEIFQTHRRAPASGSFGEVTTG